MDTDIFLAFSVSERANKIDKSLIWSRFDERETDLSGEENVILHDRGSG